MVGGGHLALFCGGRRLVVLGLLLGFVLGVALLGFEWEWLWFSEFGNGLFWDFIKAGFQPAFDYEDGLPVTGAEPFWMKVVKAVGVTLKYAVAGVSLALVIGSVMAVGASEAWWPRRRGARVTAVLQSFRFLVRGLATLMRSVHEFLWMLVFLAAFGTSGWAAVWALALPFGGILGKVFSEVLDEQSRMAAEVVEVTGGGGLMGFFLGVLPKALPDLLSYTLYRFECAVRSGVVGVAGEALFGGGSRSKIWKGWSFSGRVFRGFVEGSSEVAVFKGVYFCGDHDGNDGLVGWGVFGEWFECGAACGEF